MQSDTNNILLIKLINRKLYIAIEICFHIYISSSLSSSRESQLGLKQYQFNITTIIVFVKSYNNTDFKIQFYFLTPTGAFGFNIVYRGIVSYTIELFLLPTNSLN